MQQFQNPNYFNQQYYQQQYNPYMQRMENLQQFQQAIQQPLVPTQMSGANQISPFIKIVESIDMVKATDIPMDGNMYYFPKADSSEIYGKAWTSNGQTRILTFKPQFDNDTDISSNENEKLILGTLEQFLEGIQNDIKVLNEKIDKISKPTRQRKEVSEDE